MNPPFSVMANVGGRMADAAFRHVASALARLAPGGRLVTITGAGFAPDNRAWSAAFARLQERGRVVFSAAIDGSVYAKHGTTIPTRLTVIDKLPADDPTVFPASLGVAPDVATLIGWLAEHLPARLPVDPSAGVPNESTRVYRLQTDAGERIIGRKVSPASAANATTTGATALTPDEAFIALMDGRTILDLSEGLQLRRTRVMGANRIELSGFTDTMRERLTAYGLFHEIISWKLRMFVPVDANGPAVLARLLDRWPVERIGEREAA
ncbi:hypothetical protein SAMN02982922_0675 [Mesorhizobium australicum]|uniref:Uncharacterized protein n=1 Tax=Mesorhizobium australicum TaxID=536018 RepID=A0A1X7MSY7_9HYPH|nr:hypothetical protein SAMN02982922_0675 [Mesorhizobium australicum]